MGHNDEKTSSKAPGVSVGTPPAVSGAKRGEDSRTMPKDFSISLASKGGTDRLLMNPGTERLQHMRGFDETYVDIVDYIVRVTHRIWEEKHVGYIYDTYRHNARVTDGSGL